MIIAPLMKISEDSAYYLTDKTGKMNSLLKFFLAIPLILFVLFACNRNKEAVNPEVEKAENFSDTGLIIVAKDIITEVIVNPVAVGDPWENEKIQGYNGKQMIDKLFDDIYSGRLLVFDYHTGMELTLKDVKKLEEGFKPDRSSIGKIQFTEDWYFNPQTDAIVKDIKSIVLGSELKEETGNIYGYKAIFQVRYKE